MKEIAEKEGAKLTALVQLGRNARPPEQFRFFWVKGLCCHSNCRESRSEEGAL